MNFLGVPFGPKPLQSISLVVPVLEISGPTVAADFKPIFSDAMIVAVPGSGDVLFLVRDGSLSRGLPAGRLRKMIRFDRAGRGSLFLRESTGEIRVSVPVQVPPAQDEWVRMAESILRLKGTAPPPGLQFAIGQDLHFTEPHLGLRAAYALCTFRVFSGLRHEGLDIYGIMVSRDGVDECAIPLGFEPLSGEGVPEFLTTAQVLRVTGDSDGHTGLGAFESLIEMS